MRTPAEQTLPEASNMGFADSVTTTHQKGNTRRCRACGELSASPYCPLDGTVIERFQVDSYHVAARMETRAEAFLFHGTHVSGHRVLIALSRTTGENNVLRRAAHFDHERAVQVLACGHDRKADVDFVVFDHPEGTTVLEYVKANGPLTFSVAAQTLIETASCMAASRARATPHGGIVASDVWIVPPSFSPLTISGLGFGPESNEGWANVRDSPPESDEVHALGRLAFRMLTAKQWQHSETRWPDALPAPFVELMGRCLESPDGLSLSDFVRGLSALLSEEETSLGVDPLIGSMVGSYRIESLLGEGGMGTVYKGVHPRIGTSVAIKIIHADIASSPTTVQRFEREARASSAIGSPHIPSFYDFGMLADGRPYAVLEFFEGESLGERVENHGPLSIDAAARVLVQAAGALSEAHEKNIVHRDVKPDNIFLAKESSGVESVRVLDFGIAKLATQEGEKNLTRAGSFLGTPAYCAPEQMYGLEPTLKMDIYALGATAYEILTGELPFGGDLQSILKEKAAGTPPSSEPLARLPAVVRRTVLRALAHHPEKRFQTMEAFANSVAKWSDGAAPARSKWSRWAMISVVIALVAAIAVGTWLSSAAPVDPARPIVAEPFVETTNPLPTGTEVEAEAEATMDQSAAPLSDGSTTEVLGEHPPVEGGQPESRMNSVRMSGMRVRRRDRAGARRGSHARMSRETPVIADPFAN